MKKLVLGLGVSAFFAVASVAGFADNGTDTTQPDGTTTTEPTTDGTTTDSTNPSFRFVGGHGDRVSAFLVDNTTTDTTTNSQDASTSTDNSSATTDSGSDATANQDGVDTMSNPDATAPDSSNSDDDSSYE